MTEVVRARIGDDARVRAIGGPAFRFSGALPDPGPLAIVDDEARLAHAFTGCEALEPSHTVDEGNPHADDNECT